ncbi:acyl-CoA dehydrogenase family protein [Burkholderia sp. Leaf177]|uniref:acyl-CoA dehydrogenase family protein n=1 Tax=Burkholderia sp. Leaf177 TaxID=1736287 RepID=UPI0022857EC0|nr:acyl-CoA dehydrogenase family protein [Burkholderia sp. Leaf177]
MKRETEQICQEIILPAAGDIDENAVWPEAGMRSLQRARLTGLTAPARVGGHGQGLLGMVTLTETLGAACSSTAMCFGMHCVATAVIAAKANARMDSDYLGPIAAGEHLTTLALSESGTGSFFFLPETKLHRNENGLIVEGTKQFVTNGAHADSYVVSTVASVPSAVGDFSCLVVDKDAPGIRWGEPWQGLGMRGNASRPMHLDQVRVSPDSVLGQEGDQVWFVFEVVAPFFLMAMAGTYLGVAQTALNVAMNHLKSRRHSHSATSLSDVEVIQHRVGELWTGLQKSRLLVYEAARLGDSAHPDALTYLLASKADVARTAVEITNEAMSLCGGIAYRENSTLSRLLRDARASHVMSPTTEMLTLWTGRSAMGLPLI